MKSRIAAFLTVVGLVGGTWGALAVAGNSAGGQSASAGQYCETDTSCGPRPTPPPPKNVSVSSHTVRPGQPVEVDFRLTKPGPVRVKLLRRVHGKTIVVGTVTITFTKAGSHNIKVTTRFGGHKLGKGSYTLSLQTGKGKHLSKAVTTNLNVR